MTPSHPPIAPRSEAYGFTPRKGKTIFRSYSVDDLRWHMRRQAAAIQAYLWKKEQNRVAARIKEAFPKPRRVHIELMGSLWCELKAAHKAAHDTARAWEEWGRL
jgi:hypothetical protein